MKSDLVDALRAEALGADLAEDDQGNLCVLTERKDGTRYSLGHVTASLVLCQPALAREAIEHIRFVAFRHVSK